MRTMRLTLFLLMIWLLPGPSTASAQTTSDDSIGFCRSTDGRLFATADQVRACLKDEATAKRVADALALAGVATGNANRELGRRLQVEKELAAEGELADGRLVKIVRLEQEHERLSKRLPTWQVVVVVAAALLVGGGMGYGAAELVAHSP